MSENIYTIEVIRDLEKQLSLERQRSSVLVEALKKIKISDTNCIDGSLDYPNKKSCSEIAEEALKKYEELGK